MRKMKEIVIASVIITLLSIMGIQAQESTKNSNVEARTEINNALVKDSVVEVCPEGSVCITNETKVRALLALDRVEELETQVKSLKEASTKSQDAIQSFLNERMKTQETIDSLIRQLSLKDKEKQEVIEAYNQKILNIVTEVLKTSKQRTKICLIC